MNTKYISFLSYIIWWLFWTTLNCILLQRFLDDWKLAATDAVVSNVILFIASIFTQNTFKLYQSGSANIPNIYKWSLTLSLICVALMPFVLPKMISENYRYASFIEASRLIRFVCFLLMLAFITVVSWLVYYVENETENNSRKTEAEYILKQAEISLIHLKLQPHFLRNSLNSIPALAGSKTNEALKMIQKLCDFHLTTLKTENEQLSMVENDLKHLPLYLEIEKVRFGSSLQMALNTNVDKVSLRLPVLLLQRSIEKAIKFGFYVAVGHVEIQISTAKVNEQLLLTITNAFDSETSVAYSGKGFRLNVVKSRIQLIYGLGNLLRTEKNILKNILKIPQRKFEEA